MQLNVTDFWLAANLLLQNNLQLFDDQDAKVLIFLDKNHFLNDISIDTRFITVPLPYTNMDELD